MAAVPRAGIVAPIALVVLASLALAACGGGDSTATVTETASSGPSPGAPATTSPATTTEADMTDTTTGADGEVPPADETVTKLTAFSSPSGNIGCYIDRRSVRCDIGDRDWNPPPAPSGCDLDYGQGIELRAGAAPAFVCAGDTALGGGDALGYGTSIAAGLLRCESEESKMTCRDTETGRGFSIAKQAYDIF